MILTLETVRLVALQLDEALDEIHTRGILLYRPLVHFGRDLSSDAGCVWT